MHLADLMQEVSLPLLARLGPVLPARAKRACMLDLSYRGWGGRPWSHSSAWSAAPASRAWEKSMARAWAATALSSLSAAWR